MSLSFSLSSASSVKTAPTRGNTFRRRRLINFLRMVDEVINERGSCRVIDLGGEMQYWDSLREIWGGRPVQILLINVAAQQSSDSRLRCIVGDACHLPQFDNRSFDLVTPIPLSNMLEVGRTNAAWRTRSGAWLPDTLSKPRTTGSQ